MKYLVTLTIILFALGLTGCDNEPPKHEHEVYDYDAQKWIPDSGASGGGHFSGGG